MKRIFIALALILILPSFIFAETEDKLAQANEWNGKGVKYDSNGEYDKAIEAYTKAIELNPKVVDAYNNRGNAYCYKGQYDKGIEDYTKAIELNPKYTAAYSNRGLVYSDKGQYDKAIKDFNKAIELNPKYAAAYYNRGLAYVNKGQYDKAIKDFNKVIELDSKLAAAYTNRGAAYHRKGQLGRAISDFQKACDMGDETGCKNLQYGSLKSTEEISEKEKLKNYILSTACVSSTVELMFFANDNTDPKAGEKIINTSSVEGYTSITVKKFNGFNCDYITRENTKNERICTRSDEKVTTFKDSTSDETLDETIVKTTINTEGGYLPYLFLKKDGLTYKKEGNIYTVALKNHSLTIDCGENKIVDSQLPGIKSKSVVDVITSPKFKAKIKLWSGKDGLTLERDIPYTDIGDLFKLLLKTK